MLGKNLIVINTKELGVSTRTVGYALKRLRRHIKNSKSSAKAKLEEPQQKAIIYIYESYFTHVIAYRPDLNPKNIIGLKECYQKSW